MQRWSTLLAIREMEIKLQDITTSYQNGPNQNKTKRKENNKSGKTKCWWGCSTIRGTLTHCWEECKTVQSVGKQTGTELPHDLEISVPGIYLREIKTYVQTSLGTQWIRICLPIQGTWVRSLVQEDPTRLGAAKPVRYNTWAHEPHLLSPCA